MLTTVKILSGLLLSLLLLISASSTAFAQRGSVTPTKTLPAYYPASYQKSGIIREVGRSSTLIISGLKYTLAAGAKPVKKWALVTALTHPTTNKSTKFGCYLKAP